MSYDRYLARDVGPYYTWSCDNCYEDLDDDGNCPYCYGEEDEDE